MILRSTNPILLAAGCFLILCPLSVAVCVLNSRSDCIRCLYLPAAVSPWSLGRDARYSSKAPALGTLQTLPARDDKNESFADTLGKVAGFSLYADV